jgi:hypothetical protein
MRVEREIKILKQLYHKNVIQLYEVYHNLLEDNSNQDKPIFDNGIHKWGRALRIYQFT